LYGAAAAATGAFLYALVLGLLHFNLSLVTIFIGYMTGKAVRKGARGLGGRPQQILATLLTYFAMNAAFVLSALFQMTNEKALPLAGMVAVALRYSLFPIFLLSPSASMVLDLLIYFFGLSQAWRLARRHDIVVTGPLGTEAP
jgi:hypothetical protein